MLGLLLLYSSVKVFSSSRECEMPRAPPEGNAPPPSSLLRDMPKICSKSPCPSTRPANISAAFTLAPELC